MRVFSLLPILAALAACQPVCRRADAQNVAMVLAVPNWRGEGLPDPTTLNGRARLAAWIWTRP